MAMSGRINGTVSNLNSYFDFYIDWDVINSQSDRVANNRSQVRARVYLKTTTTSQTFDTVVARSHWTKIDGVREDYSKRIDCNPWPSNPFLVRTYTRYVTHNSDGTKSLNISAYVDGHASSWGPDNCNASATVTLDTIPTDQDAQAETAWVDMWGIDADVVAGTPASATSGSPGITGFDARTTTTVTPEVASAIGMAVQPVRIGDPLLGAPPLVQAVSKGERSRFARTSFPCEIPRAAQPGDLMLFVLHYQADHSAIPAFAPLGMWAERTKTSVNGNNAMWVWERQIQTGEIGTTIEATTETEVVGVASIVVLRNATFNAVSATATKSTASTTTTVESISPTQDPGLFVEIASHFQATESATPVTSGEAAGWETWLDYPHHEGEASMRHGSIYVASKDYPILDGGIEVTTAGWTATSGTLTQSTVKAKRGLKSGEFVTNGSSGAGFESKDRFPVKAGSVYKATGWLNCAQAMSAGVGVGIKWYNSSGSLVATSVNLKVPSVSNWEIWTGDFAAPSGAVSASIAVILGGTPAADSTVYADELSFSPHGGWTRTLSASASDITIVLAYEYLLSRVTRLAEFSFQIDWNNDGDWDDDNDTVTRRVLRRNAVQIKYGRDQDRALSPTAPGEASFELSNISGDYYPDNWYSPLHGLIIPARPVRIRAFTGTQEYTLYRGFIDEFDLDAEFGQESVQIRCVDALVTLVDSKVTVPIHPSIRSGAAIHKVLDALKWPPEARDIDAGASTFRWWSADGTASDIINGIVGSEGAPAYVSISPNGDFIFRDRHHRLVMHQAVSSQATFRDKGTEPLFSAPMKYDHGWRDIVNHLEVTVTERRVSGEIATIWEDGQNVYAVSPGKTIEINVVKEEPFVDAIVPIAGTDYTIISGTPVVTLTETSGYRTKLKIDGGAGGCSLTGLKVRGYLLVDGATKQVDVSDPSSIEQYQMRSGSAIEAPYATYEDVHAIANITLGHRAERLPIVTFTVKRRENDFTRYVHMLTRDLSDRITIVDSKTSLNADFSIERIQHTIGELGLFHSTEFGCEKIPDQPVNAFRLDVGTLDTNVLGRQGIDNPRNVFILDSLQNVIGSNLLGN